MQQMFRVRQHAKHGIHGVFGMVAALVLLSTLAAPAYAKIYTFTKVADRSAALNITINKMDYPRLAFNSFRKDLIFSSDWIIANFSSAFFAFFK